MDDKSYTAVAADQHSISIYEVGTGRYDGFIFVTSGEITGSPIITGNNVTIAFNEGGTNYMSTYTLPGRQFVRRIQL